MKLKYTGDETHRYYLDGKQCKGVTSVASIPDNRWNIEKWQQRMVALGMATDPSLTQLAIAHYDDRAELNAIADKAMNAAKAYEGRERGTAVHRTLERFDLGETPLIDSPQQQALRAAYEKALEGAGLQIIPDMVERLVVFPDLRIAGRFDNFVRRKRDGKIACLDKKTGSSAVTYPHSTSVQLAMYCNAPFLAGPIPRQGGETEHFEWLPDNLDRKWAYIAHIPDDETVEIVKIDIAAGWDAAQKIIFPTLKWRDKKDLTKVVGSMSIEDANGPADAERVSWIKGRLSMLTMLDNAPQAKAYVGMRWPAGVPTPKSGTPWSEADIAQLDEMLTSVETDCVAGFPTKDPALETMGSA